ncbi:MULTISPECIES: hypothetical protein [Vibrio]|uniref:hypothetical protein n=1 Tax=Vibrio TaxID=662 RepID=UPI0004DD6346|nr:MULTISPECIES: hypothetical protein [Vibrio]KFA98895.1 membrane protein [Vibrio sp. ER1A]MCG9659155.1 hypothetical protein [Vibrio mediterranei]
MLKKLAFQIIPVQIFLFVFWFKNGFIDKVMGVLLGAVTPETAYAGDTWAGWKGYIVGTWDKSQVGHALLSPTFDFMFPILILLQCLPFILIIRSVLNLEFMTDRERPWLLYSAIASLFVAGCMAFTQTISGASDGQYLWQFMGFSMVAIIYIRNEQKR